MGYYGALGALAVGGIVLDYTEFGIVEDSYGSCSDCEALIQSLEIKFKETNNETN